MSGAATRWRLLELQRRRQAIVRGIDLLDRKREGLLRALAERRVAAVEQRQRLSEALARARAAVDRAFVAIGPPATESAAIAQPEWTGLEAIEDAIVGVHVLRLRASSVTYRPRYGPGGTSADVEAAGEAFVAVLPALIRTAEEEHARRALQRGLRRTTRTLNALRSVLLPALDADLRSVSAGLEEEEREESVRWRTFRTTDVLRNA